MSWSLIVADPAAGWPACSGGDAINSAKQRAMDSKRNLITRLLFDHFPRDNDRQAAVLVESEAYPAVAVPRSGRFEDCDVLAAEADCARHSGQCPADRPSVGGLVFDNDLIAFDNVSSPRQGSAARALVSGRLRVEPDLSRAAARSGGPALETPRRKVPENHPPPMMIPVGRTAHCRRGRKAKSWRPGRPGRRSLATRSADRSEPVFCHCCSTQPGNPTFSRPIRTGSRDPSQTFPGSSPTTPSRPAGLLHSVCPPPRQDCSSARQSPRPAGRSAPRLASDSKEGCFPSAGIAAPSRISRMRRRLRQRRGSGPGRLL